jgi:hypothetical protein
MPQDESRIVKKFISEEIVVIFNTPPLFTKKPEIPDGFIWRNQKYRIVKGLMAWQDFSRRGAREKNMSPVHAERASLKGSWGVGRYYFRIETSEGEIFEIYYDRAPEKSTDRSGHWYLLSTCVNNIQKIP